MKPGRARIDSIDLLRGIVMVVMMLDHTRDFVTTRAPFRIHSICHKTKHAAFFLTPLDHTLLRSHVCISRGTGAYLQFARGKSKSEMSRFLVTRGLWLIVLEFTGSAAVLLFSVDPRFLASCKSSG